MPGLVSLTVKHVSLNTCPLRREPISSPVEADLWSRHGQWSPEREEEAEQGLWPCVFQVCRTGGLSSVEELGAGVTLGYQAPMHVRGSGS